MTRSRMPPGRTATGQNSPDQPGPRPFTIAASSRRVVPSVAAPNDPQSSDRPTFPKRRPDANQRVQLLLPDSDGVELDREEVSVGIKLVEVRGITPR